MIYAVLNIPHHCWIGTMLTAAIPPIATNVAIQRRGAMVPVLHIKRITKETSDLGLSIRHSPVGRERTCL